MFDIHQEAFEYDEWSDKFAHDYGQGLFEAFRQSPEGQACQEHLGGLGWTDTFLHYGISYCGTIPPRMSRQQFDEVLFELIPRQVSTDAGSAASIVTELRAFWEFLSREYELPHARAYAAALDAKATARLKRELSNSANFGMAKSLFMLGDEMGFDMTTQEGLNEFMVRYNRSLGMMAPPARADEKDEDEAFDSRFQPNATVPRRSAEQHVPQPTADERRAMNQARQKELQAIKRRRK